MKLKDLIIKAPALCGITGIDAKRFGATARLIWEAEMQGLAKEFDDCEDGQEHPGQRIKHMFMWLHELTNNTGKAIYIRKLAELCALKHRINEHDQLQFTAEAKVLEAEVAQEENLYPDVAEVYTADAAAQGVWW